MAIESRNDLKQFFQTGDIPTETNFSDLMDSYIHKEDDGVSLIDVSSNKRFGIGTASPTEALEVVGALKIGGGVSGVGSGTIKFDGNDFLGKIGADWKSLTGATIVSSQWVTTGNNIYYADLAGNVGIGNPSPFQKLDIRGDKQDGPLGIGIRNSAIVEDRNWLIAHVNDIDVVSDDGRLSISQTDINGVPTERFIINKEGNTGIGVVSPKQKLEVSGAIRIGPDAGVAPVPGTIRYAQNQGGNYDVEAFIGSDWVSLTYAGGGDVTSVNGLTGVVVITKSTLSLGNVDNTSDANKPVSTATQTALNLKADQSALSLKANIQPAYRSGTNINFDMESEYGSEDITESGDISFVPGAGIRGVTAMIIHNNATEPNFDPEFVKLSGSSEYVPNEINYIFCNYRSDTKIIYTISQTIG